MKTTKRIEMDIPKSLTPGATAEDMHKVVGVVNAVASELLNANDGDLKQTMHEMKLVSVVSKYLVKAMAKAEKPVH